MLSKNITQCLGGPIAAVILMLFSFDAASALIHIEVENLQLETYLIEENDFASAGKVISLRGASSGQGSASLKFNGDSGNYAVVVNYVDENDGSARLKLFVNDELEEIWILSRDLGAASPIARTFTARTIQGGIAIKTGDTIRIEGSRDRAEAARVDFIQLIPESLINEAESAILAEGRDLSIRHAVPGFTGDGYAKFFREGSIQWDIVLGATGGDYALEFRYSLGGDDLNRPLDIYVNDELAISKLRFVNTGSFTRWKTANAVVRLDPGLNKVKAVSTGSRGAFIDHLAVAPARFLTLGGSLTPRPSSSSPECNPGGSPDPDYLDTYYGIVDPNCKRATLEGFQAVNGFDRFKDIVINAKFINAGDLGFGRDMFCLDATQMPCYVENYLDPKGKSELIATVAMERMNFSGRTIVAFFVYDMDGNRINTIPDGHRLNQIPLDSEGAKSVPESCYGCHFGFTTAGGNPSGGQYLPFDIASFEDWPGRPALAEQLEQFRRLNRAIWRDVSTVYNRAIFSNYLDPTTFLRFEQRPRKESVKKLIEGWYDGPPLANTEFNADRLPAAEWYTDPLGFQAPPGSDKFKLYFRERFLYKTVYERFCRSCHVAQGEAQDVNAEFDGLDWVKAIPFAIEAYSIVCESTEGRPLMPHAEVPFNRFRDELIRTPGGKVATAKERLCAEAPPPPLPTDPPSSETTYVDVIQGDESNKRCVKCHGGRNPSDELDLSGNIRMATVGKSKQVPGLNLVSPGKPEESYLFRKLEGTHAEVGGRGSNMGNLAGLDSASIQIIRKWIEDGAVDIQ